MTAQKRAESAQETPLSLTVLSAEGLERHSLSSISELQTVTPGLTFRNSTTDNLSPLVAMRGQAQTRVDLGKQPSVALYYDGVYTPTGAGAAVGAGFLDVERVEVLKGPQGTLFGRNTPGGAINIITKDPVQRFEALAQGTLTYNEASKSMASVGGVLNVPVSDDAALRIVSQFQEDEGYGTDVTHDRELGDTDLKAVRAAFSWHASDALELLLRADYQDAESGGQFGKPTALAAGTAAAFEAAAEQGLPLAQNAVAVQNVLNGVPRDRFRTALDEEFPMYTRLKVWGGSLTATYKFSEDLELKSITAYRQSDKSANQDPDATPVRAAGCAEANGCNNVEFDQLTQELQLHSTLLDGRLDLIGGLYYFRLEGTDDLTFDSVPLVNPAAPIVNRADITDESVSGFVHGIYAISDRVELVAGTRYTWEENVFIGNNFTATACNVPLPDRINGACFARFPATFKDWSWTTAINYRPVDGVMAYANVSRSFKAGGQNTFGTSVRESYAPFGPEQATQYELGLKADWLNQSLRTNIAVFYTDLKDVQRAITVVDPNTLAVASTTKNAASATVSGVELETVVVPVERLEIRAAVSYTDAEYDKYFDPVLGDLSARVFPSTPEWQFSGSGLYSWPLRVGALSAGFDWYYQSKQDYDPDNHSVRSGRVGLEDERWLFDARMSLQFEQQNLDLALFAKNLTDETYLVGAVDITGGLGTGVQYFGPPRTFGFQLTKRF